MLAGFAIFADVSRCSDPSEVALVANQVALLV